MIRLSVHAIIFFGAASIVIEEPASPENDHFQLDTLISISLFLTVLNMSLKLSLFEVQNGISFFQN